MKKIILIGLLCFTVSGTAFSQVIWQKALKGMSSEQVKKVFPKAEKVEPTSGTTLGDGAERLLQVSDYEINGFKFDAYFYFKDKKLIQVTLNSKEEYPEIVYKKMIEAFRLKYGAELSTNNMRIGQEKKWITPDKTEITVSFMAGKMNIYYSARASEELNKL